ncbi:hypothetical protein I4U23_019215 [Adineta vaga]|nr:hypothetical protein I4U23_019215 [Adineta vaga]
MEAENDSARDKRANLATNPSLPYLMGCCCLGLILFTIALTIVMALIPTYLPSKADGLSRTNYTSMIAQMQAESGTAVGRKRQSSVDLNNYIGGEFGSSGREQVRQIIRQYLNSPSVKDVTILSVGIANRADSKKKRMALDRDVRQLSTIIYDIKMIFTFDNTCPYFCQTKAGATLQQILYNISPSAFVFNNVEIFRDGSSIGSISQQRFSRISFVSSILSSFSPFQPGAGPVTRAYTGTTSMSSTGISG